MTTHRYKVDAIVQPEGSDIKHLVWTQYFEDFEAATRAVALEEEKIEFKGFPSDQYFFHLQTTKEG